MIKRKYPVIRMKFAPGMRWFCAYSYVFLPFSILFSISDVVNVINSVVTAEDKSYINWGFFFVYVPLAIALVCVKFREYYLLNRILYGSFHYVMVDAGLCAFLRIISNLAIGSVDSSKYGVVLALIAVYTIWIMLQYIYFKKRKNSFIDVHKND